MCLYIMYALEAECVVCNVLLSSIMLLLDFMCINCTQVQRLFLLTSLLLWRPTILSRMDSIMRYRLSVMWCDDMRWSTCARSCWPFSWLRQKLEEAKAELEKEGKSVKQLELILPHKVKSELVHLQCTCIFLSERLCTRMHACAQPCAHTWHA